MRRTRSRFTASSVSIQSRAVTRSLPSQSLGMPSPSARSFASMGGSAIIPVTSYPGGAGTYLLGCAPLAIYTPPATALSSLTTGNGSK